MQSRPRGGPCFQEWDRNAYETILSQQSSCETNLLYFLQRTGRSDATYSAWRLQDGHSDPPLTRAGRVTADMFWERITYFLERIIPVAEENKIRMACHHHDPGVPPEGYQGVTRVLGTVDGLKKFIAIKESPYHGLNFCQGTVSEMLADPGKDIHDVI